MEKIENKGKKNVEILSATHPSFDNRVTALKKLIAEEGLDKLDYATLDERFRKYVRF